MEPTARLFQCALCHIQTMVCSKCDHGQIYCGDICAIFARKRSLKTVRARYQSTFKGKQNHAACQARYRMKLINLSKKVTSPLIKVDPLVLIKTDPLNAQGIL